MATKKKIGYDNYRLKPLQIITADAKKIQAANPKIKWVDAIKKASAKYRVNLVANPGQPKKTIDAKKTAKKNTIKKKAAPVKKAAKKKVISKPIQAKLFGAKKPAGIQTKSRSHTDYNKPTVNIQIGSAQDQKNRLVFASGMRDGIEQNISQIIIDIDRCKKIILSSKNPIEKAFFRKTLATYKRELVYYKGQLVKQNQHIKTLLK